MLSLSFSLMSILTTIIFMFMNHPLAMGLMLLIQTTLIACIIGLMMKTFWFSYILFLTFLGGMLILFIYVTSLASNEMFSFSSKILIIISSILSMMMIMMMIMDKSIIMFFINNTEMSEFFNLKFLFKENYLNLNKLYNFPMNLIMLMMVLYLLLTLIIIVKITNFNSGPLRANI
ncbi:NADH dehydrogenase subunit 6 (mitochondrion) [Phlebotomus papatasi]|uniref:NADH-ubiquinone oxidoreductase chain 6 n=1 Tax=Phlebotomus papatasi TaxID=29031 RepID=A0A0N9DSR8_PHLPP|nr:NADH dehydrogenase subunit 6 [Phlebotomus papatasi]ALF07258.1 NADH dehydrogenase subunit 6 [Phlebotomus papatasi]